MDDPLEMEAPENILQRVHALAYDLAYGVVQGLWGPEFSSGADDWYLLEDKDSEELFQKWQDKWPSARLLMSFGYLEKTRELTSTDRYVLTPKAFELLEQIAPSSVFISYKRKESSAFALLLHARIKMALGSNPFLDMNIQAGDEWREELRDRVRSSQYFICLVSPETLRSEYVRQEISWALESQARIIPIWHDGFDDAKLVDYQAQYPELEGFYSKQAIRVENENPVAYEGVIIQLLNRFGVTPA